MDDHADIDVQPETADTRITFEERGRKFVVIKVLESELRDVGTSQNTLNINLGFFTLMAGLAGGFITVLLTSHQNLSDRVLMVFVALAGVSTVLSTFFGLRTKAILREAKQKLESIISGKSKEVD